MKEAEAMWARRVAHGGYTGPAYEDESNFHRVLDSRVSLGHEHWQSDMCLLYLEYMFGSVLVSNFGSKLLERS